MRANDVDLVDEIQPRLSNKRSVEEWVVQIQAKWQDNVACIFSVARDLETARAELGERSKEWVRLYRDELKFSKGMVSQLIAIAEDENGNLGSVEYTKLPPSWFTLYKLAKLTPEEFQAGVENGVIHAGMQQKDVAQLKPPKPKKPKIEPMRPSSAIPLDEAVEMEMHSLLSRVVVQLPKESHEQFFTRLHNMLADLEKTAQLNSVA